MRISDWSSDVCSSDLLIVLVPAAQWYYAGRTYPPINDIATNLENPPIFRAMPRPGAYPGGETAALQRAAYPGLQPLSLDIAPERAFALARALVRSEEHTSELQSLMRISYAVFCLNKKKTNTQTHTSYHNYNMSK